jgi:hypothetical protein
MKIRRFAVLVVLGCMISNSPAAANGYQGYIASLDPILRERIQVALRDKGFDPGAVDSRYGTKTEKALLAFRKANQINEGELDSVLTPKLAKALLDIDVLKGPNGDQLSPEEQVLVLRKLGLVPTRNYWKSSGIVFPD